MWGEVKDSPGPPTNGTSWGAASTTVPPSDPSRSTLSPGPLINGIASAFLTDPNKVRSYFNTVAPSLGTPSVLVMSAFPSRLAKFLRR